MCVYAWTENHCVAGHLRNLYSDYYRTCNNQIINNSDYYRNLYSDDYAFET